MLENVYQWILNYEYTYIIFNSYLAVASLCFLFLWFKFLFFLNRQKVLKIKRGKGIILISRKTIASIVRYSYGGINQVAQSKVSVSLSKKPEKTRVFVKISFSDTTNLAEITKKIQTNIEQCLFNSLDVNITNITLKIVENKNANHDVDAYHAPVVRKPLESKPLESKPLESKPLETIENDTAKTEVEALL